MKNIICIICNTPLKIRGKYACFKCMCDEDIRIIPLEDIEYYPQIHLLNNKSSTIQNKI